MRALLRVLIAIILLVNTLSLSSWASDNPMLDFYSGLTEIINKNMDSPKACVSQAESYIKSNIKTLHKATEAGREMTRNNTQKYENMSGKDLESAIAEAEKAMSDSKVAESMNASMSVVNRFMDALNEFATKHPAEGERISEILSEYS